MSIHRLLHSSFFFLNISTAIRQQLIRTARTLEEEWWVASLPGSVGTGTKEDESSTGRVWADGFHNFTARSRLARVLNLRNVYFFNFPNFFSGRGQPRLLHPRKVIYIYIYIKIKKLHKKSVYFLRVTDPHYKVKPGIHIYIYIYDPHCNVKPGIHIYTTKWKKASITYIYIYIYIWIPGFTL